MSKLDRFREIEEMSDEAVNVAARHINILIHSNDRFVSGEDVRDILRFIVLSVLREKRGALNTSK